MAKLGLIGICYDIKSSFMRGAAEGPPAIRSVLHDGASNHYAECGINPLQFTIDEGDFSSIEYSQIGPIIERFLEIHESLLIWGGDHSITFPVIKSYKKKYKDFDIIHFDAHGDLYDEFEGDKYSHACPFARIMEEGLCHKLIQIGIRTLNPHQREQVRKWNIQCIEMKNIEQINQLTFTRPVYLSIDLDGFDPAYAPGVSHQEPGGLVPRDVINFINGLPVPVIGADIVEYNPRRDISHITASLAAKMTKEVAAKIITAT